MTTTSESIKAAGPSDQDKAAVAAIPAKIVKAWADHDADAFAGAFTADGSMILPGVFQKGQDSIRSFMTDAFEGFLKGTRVTGSPIDLKFFGGDAGMLITLGGVLHPGDDEVTAERAIRATWTVVKQDGEWLLTAYQNSPANPA